MHLYPDGAGFELKAALSERLRVDADRLVLGNGSNDVLELVARAYLQPGDEVVFSEYAFAVYPLVTLACSATPVRVESHLYGHDLAAMADAITERTRIVFLANPNNPTGTWFNDHALDAFLARVPEEVLVVLDEAYFEYVEESHYPDGLTRLRDHPNLVVTRTFSKIHGLAGLRVGYGVAHPQVADVLNRVRQPFNVNIPALAAAQAALDDHDHIENSKGENAAGLAQLAEGLAELNLERIPSVANFVTFDCGGDALPVYEALLRDGVIVRPLGGYGLPNHLRVTIGTAPRTNASSRPWVGPWRADGGATHVPAGGDHRPGSDWRLFRRRPAPPGAGGHRGGRFALGAHPGAGPGPGPDRRGQPGPGAGGARRRPGVRVHAGVGDGNGARKLAPGLSDRALVTDGAASKRR